MSSHWEPKRAGERRQLRGAAAIEHALLAGEPVRIVLHVRESPSARVDRLLALAERHGVETRAISERELRRLAQVSNPVSSQAEQATSDATAKEASAEPVPELLAMLGADPRVELDGLLARGGAVWLLAGTAYPGNAGFAIRTAEVSGAAGVVIDASFDRTARRDAARAAMRADRHLPVLFESTTRVLDAARHTGHRIVVIEDVGCRAPWEVDLRGSVVFVVGGEEHGVPAEAIERADEIVRIPMAGFLPSYNLQAAMAAVMGERLRQLSITD